jgi:hypothetical protein
MTMEGNMPQTEVISWLHRAIIELPMVTTQLHPRGGTEYQLGDFSLGLVEHSFVYVDTGPEFGGRVRVDLSEPDGGTTALWLLCRNYRLATSPNSVTGHATFEAPAIPPSIRILDEVGISSLRSSPPGP